MSFSLSHPFFLLPGIHRAAKASDTRLSESDEEKDAEKVGTDGFR